MPRIGYVSNLNMMTRLVFCELYCILITAYRFLQDDTVPYEPPRLRIGETTTSRPFRFYGRELAGGNRN